jgi:hypothetical protein
MQSATILRRSSLLSHVNDFSIEEMVRDTFFFYITGKHGRHLLAKTVQAYPTLNRTLYSEANDMLVLILNNTQHPRYAPAFMDLKRRMEQLSQSEKGTIVEYKPFRSTQDIVIYHQYLLNEGILEFRRLKESYFSNTSELKSDTILEPAPNAL